MKPSKTQQILELSHKDLQFLCIKQQELLDALRRILNNLPDLLNGDL